MRLFLSITIIACCVVSPDSSAAEKLAMGKLLVATDEVQGAIFAETVILLLHYDESCGDSVLWSARMVAILTGPPQ